MQQVKIRFKVSARGAEAQEYRDRLDGLTDTSTQVEALIKTNGSTIFTLTTGIENVMEELYMLDNEFDISETKVEFVH